MICKYCQAELEEDVTVCPVCGKPLEEAEQAAAPETEAPEETCPEVPEADAPEAEAAETAPEETPEEDLAAVEKNEKKEKLLFRVTAILSCAVLLFALVAGILTAVVGPMRANTLTGNSIYTVDDKVALRNGNVVVATMGDAELTNSMLQLIYWDLVIDFVNRYYDYLAYLNLDYTQPLYEQLSGENDTTWEHYFLSNALDTWQQYQALVLEAEKNNFELSADTKNFLGTIRQSLTEAALANNFADADALAQEDYGAGVTCEIYEDYLWIYYTAISYFDVLFNELEVTDGEIEAYFEEHSASLLSNYGVHKDSGKLIDVRHILIMPEGGTTDEAGNTTYSEDEWEACRQKAQALLDEYLAGETTENAFAQLALQNNQDPGSQSNGGLYEKVVENQMVVPFNDWCFDESRQSGDTGLVKTDFGYHVMYYVCGDEGWIRYCEEGVRSEKGSELLSGILEDYPVTVDYRKISIANNSLG